jgi:hypothetical protein
MTVIPMSEPDERHPDALTWVQRLHRRVAAVMALSPGERFVSGDTRAIPLDVKEAIESVRLAGNTLLRPRTKPTVVGGYERAEPSGTFWCVAAGLTTDDGAGARMIQSEAGSLIARGYVQYGVAVGLATCNEAYARAGRYEPGSAFHLVTSDMRHEHAGYFGRQSGRWCASLQDPTERALECWRVASQLHGDGMDFTAGARRWDDGWTQDRLWKAGKVNHDALGICRKWAAEGWEWVGPIFATDGKTPLIDPYRLMLFRYVGRRTAEVWRGEQAIKDGRSRWGMR